MQARTQSRASIRNRSASFQRDGKFYEPGETFVAAGTGAHAGAHFAKNGAKEFYEGETAKKLAEAEAKNGGLITLADLKNYDGGGAQAAHRQI